MSFEKEKQDLIDTARRMEKYDLIRMSGGNVSLRVKEDLILVTPTAMDYDTMVIDDIVAVDLSGNIVEGKRRPTSDLKAILYIMNHMPEVNALIHTHQPSAVALSLIADELPVISTTMLEEVKGKVNVAPFTISSDEGMGVETCRYASGSLCVILKSHGVMAYGKSLDQALCAALYLEESCEIYLKALASGLPISILSEKQIQEESEIRGYYGQ